EPYTLSLHDALPIWRKASRRPPCSSGGRGGGSVSATLPPSGGSTGSAVAGGRFLQNHLRARPVSFPSALLRQLHPLRTPERRSRSEEHTSELQSLRH